MKSSNRAPDAQALGLFVDGELDRVLRDVRELQFEIARDPRQAPFELDAHCPASFVGFIGPNRSG